MVDQRVLEAQQWVNATYGAVPGYVPCAESGRTGWATMYSLTRALQHELGITALSDSFGPATLSALEARGPIGLGATASNIVRIAQHGLFCKGYSAGLVTGVFHLATQRAVGELMSDAGVEPDGTLRAKWFKAILTMDAYVLTTGGDAAIRTIQQWLNSRYINRSTFFAGPCDGHFSRDVQIALMKGIQYESGIPEAQVNGNFGPATQAGLRAHRVGPGWTGTWVQLFSAACVCNGAVGARTAPFTGTWTAGLTEFVVLFQRFSVLDATGEADYRTWAQLLVSSGDPDRPASACDTRFPLTPERARALYDAGYRIVGRYLDRALPTGYDKEIHPGELDAIFGAGLRVFPISQYSARDVTDFTYALGQQHAARAHDRAAGYGFNQGTVLYFSVDFDATDAQITSNVVPYFHGVQFALAERGRRYVAGVYGSRNVCTRVSTEANARYSFVSGMSYGYSGNLGFPMPANWSFNQIREFSFAQGGTPAIDLDHDVHRPVGDPAVGPENVGVAPSPLTEWLSYLDELQEVATAYGPGDATLRVMEFLRYPTYVDLYDGWQNLIGDVDRDWIAFAESVGPRRVLEFQDPSYGVTIKADHFGATANAEYLRGGGTGTDVSRGDFGGWGGDLCTFYGEWRAQLASYPSGYDFCVDRLAKVNVSSSFPLSDLIEDADGFIVGARLRDTGGRFSDAVRLLLTTDLHVHRFDRLLYRMGGTVSSAGETARTMLTSGFFDIELSFLRGQAIRTTGGGAVTMPENLPAGELDPFLRGFGETLLRLANP